MTRQRIEAEVEVEFLCPFCGRPASVGREKGTETPAVFHGMPMCDRFATLGPIEYLAAVNAAIT